MVVVAPVAVAGPDVVEAAVQAAAVANLLRVDSAAASEAGADHW